MPCLQILSGAEQADSGDEDYDDNADDDDELEVSGSPGRGFGGIVFPSRGSTPEDDLDDN